ncbi:Uncharacterized protein BCRIVMBC845_06469 [Bacillus cereus]|nr:Uncharacterized protein BCRIVMBC845_06469 [Bacillus cereus]
MQQTNPQVQVNIDERAIRSELGTKLGAAQVEIAVLTEQVQALATDKINLEMRINELEAERSAANAAKEPTSPETEIIDA